jgi:hypothetical protein
MKKANVIRRFNTGDFIRYSLSGKKYFVREKIVALTDTCIITTNDTVQYHRIRIVDVESDQGSSGITLQNLGWYSVAAGIILPLGDLINTTLVQDNQYEADTGVIVTSATLVTAGVVMMMVDKPFLKIRMNNRLRIIDHRSPLYKR